MPALQHMNQPRGYPQKLSHALSRYREYLKSCYSLFSIARDDKLFGITSCSQFINLALINKERSLHHNRFSKSTFYGGVDEIVASKTPLEMDDLLMPDSRFVLVEGPPGIGKSTLCWELCRKWDTLPSLQHYKIVLQLKLRERRVQNAIELNEIFLHQDKKLCQSVVDEVREGEGVLLVLDGFDEMPASVVKDRSSLIMKLIGGTCLPVATRLVTSRPSALHLKTIFPEDYRHIEILGFTDEYKVQFAEIAFKSEPDVFDHFKKFIFSNPVIKSLMYIPVNCAIIAQVYKDIRRSSELMPKTMTQLYTTLVLVLIRRRMIEKGEWDEDSEVPDNLEELKEEIIPILKRVSELAYRGLVEEEGQLEFSDLGQDFEHLGLLSASKEMYMKGPKTLHSFPHLSIQEFLAAWHLKCSPHLISNFITRLDSMPRLEIVGKFIAGLRGCSGFPIERMEKKMEFMAHCLYEAQNSCKSLEGHVDPNYIFYYNSVTPLDTYIFGYVLAHAPIRWKLILHADHSDVSQLANSCKSSDKVLGSIPDLYIQAFQAPSLSDFENFPTYLFEQIGKLKIVFESSSLVPVSTTWISSLRHNLHDLALCLAGPRLKDGHLFYQAIGSYPKLRAFEFRFSDNSVSINDLKVLSESIASSHTLENMALHFKDATGRFVSVHKRLQLHSLVEAALSCSTLKMLSTNIPFSAFSDTISPNLEAIKFEPFEYWCGCWTYKTVYDCLCCIANMCKIPSMTSLEIALDNEYHPAFDKFLVILNHSLRCNSSFTDLTLDGLHFYLRGTFSTALRTHPSLLWNRSKSLSDLSTAWGTSESESDDQSSVEDASESESDDQSAVEDASESEGYNQSITLENASKDRCQSCPDLLQMQPLHNIHPKLY